MAVPNGAAGSHRAGADRPRLNQKETIVPTPQTVTLTLLDPVTLDVLAEYDLPGYLRTSLLDRLPGA